MFAETVRVTNVCIIIIIIITTAELLFSKLLTVVSQGFGNLCLSVYVMFRLIL